MVSLLLFHPLCGLHLPFVSNIVLSNFERRLKNWDSDTKGSTNFKFVFSTIFGSSSKRLATLQNFTVANLVLCLLILFFAQTLNIVKIDFACTQALYMYITVSMDGPDACQLMLTVQQFGPHERDHFPAAPLSLYLSSLAAGNWRWH